MAWVESQFILGMPNSAVRRSRVDAALVVACRVGRIPRAAVACRKVICTSRLERRCHWDMALDRYAVHGMALLRVFMSA